MNRIVRDHYPKAKLPEDLTEGLGKGEEVRVTVEALPSAVPILNEGERPGLFSQFRHLAVPRFASLDEINDHVRTLRDEWDEHAR